MARKDRQQAPAMSLSDLIQWAEEQATALESHGDKSLGGKGYVDLPVASPKPRTVRVTLHGPSALRVLRTKFESLVETVCGPAFAVEIRQTFPADKVITAKDLRLSMTWFVERAKSGADDVYSKRLVGNRIPDPTPPLSIRQIAVYIRDAEPSDQKAMKAAKQLALEWMKLGRLPANRVTGKGMYVVSESALERLRKVERGQSSSSRP